MNTFDTEQLTATHKANLQALASAGNNAFAGFEKLVELNMAASKAMMDESFATLQSVAGAKDPAELLALQSDALQSAAEKSTSYGKHLVALVTEFGAELTQMAEGNMAQSQKSLSDLVENISRNAPAGSESAMALFKNTVAASQNAIESARKSAKSTLAMAESNYATMTDQAVKASRSVSKKA